MRARWGDREGLGVLEQLAFGEHHPSGLTGILDGYARANPPIMGAFAPHTVEPPIDGRVTPTCRVGVGVAPNILLIVSDQERQRGWLPASVRLPARNRLLAEGLEFTNHYTHSSPCSPSRASLFTGQYLPQHGVVDNVIMPEHVELDPAIPTIGSILRDAGYRSSYIGKWHLSHAPSPDMTQYGFADWEGNDRHFMGWAGTGVHFDPIIAANAAAWLRTNAATLRRSRGSSPSRSSTRTT